MYLVYRKNNYPEINEPCQDLIGVFKSKKDVERKRKEGFKQYPILFGKKDLVIEKITVNKFF